MNNSSNISPPAWPLKLLRIFLREEFLEEIEGDMEEMFFDNVERTNVSHARRTYALEMIKLLRPNLIRHFTFIHHLMPNGMFNNYFKISIRGLLKNPTNSFINIFGLSVAIGFCILVYSFARWTYDTDQFHEHKDHVFITTIFANRDGAPQQYGITPRPLAEMMKTDLAHVKKVCRVKDESMIVRRDDQLFTERIRYTDATFLEMLTFPLKWGEAKTLGDINSIILSERMSQKYFGTLNPIGHTLILRTDKDAGKSFKVTGVAEAFPKSRTIGFDFLVNIENLTRNDSAYLADDWSSFVDATLIQVDDPAHITSVEAGMHKYQALQNGAVNKEWAITGFAFKSLGTIHKTSADLRDHISRNAESNYDTVFFLIIIGIFMLAIACFNYINIAIVTASKRLREIGVRKSIGASRKAVITQFLSENVVITGFALFIGLIIGVVGFIPWFETINDFSMEFRLTDPTLWIFLPGVLLFTALASGIYPSLYISGFQVVRILKGSVTFGQKNPLTKSLLVFQLILACILITAGVMFTQNSAWLADRSWGYENKGTLYTRVENDQAFEKLSAVMSQNPNVISIAGSAHHIGKEQQRTIIHLADRECEVDELQVDAEYLETMGVTILRGRAFNNGPTDDQRAIVINELFATTMGWNNPVGQQVEIDGTKYEVVGVARNFHSYDFSMKLNPLLFRVADPSDYRYLTMKVRQGQELSLFRDLQAQWSKLFPETPFQGEHQEDVWGDYYQSVGNHGRVWRVIAVLTTLMAGLGLYGLITLNVAGRTREFSIRKILGAGAGSISGNIISQYVALFAIALLIGAPVSFLLMKLMFDSSYAYHMPITPGGVFFAVIILVLVLMITAATQIRKVMTSNPVSGLKQE